MPEFLQQQNTWITISVLLLGGAALYYWRRRQGGEAASGGGVPLLMTYTRDLTREAEEGKLDRVVGREEEVERVIHILSRRRKNNPILLGDPGVGKTAVVEGLALLIARKQVPESIMGKRVLALDMTGLISGTKYRGEFEQRIKKILSEIVAAKRTIILFIDEVHMIVQAKGAEGALNVSDMLKPLLARGELQTIGATTSHEYEQYIRPDDALDRRFQPVTIGEPTLPDTIAILRGVKDAYETHHHVRYRDEALIAAANLAAKYIKGRFLPDKAIDLIDEAGAKVGIEASHGARHAAGVLHAAGESKKTRQQELQEKRSALAEEIKHLESLEKSMKDEELVEVRKRLEHLASEIDRLDKEGAGSKEAPEVTEEDIREIVADWAGIPKNKVV
ncbi:MAG: AAA family ATPase [Patescibacteria group bacterium]